MLFAYVSNTGAWGWYSAGNLTYTAPSSWFPANSGIGGYISADLGYWELGTSNSFYGTRQRGSPQTPSVFQLPFCRAV